MTLCALRSEPGRFGEINTEAVALALDVRFVYVRGGGETGAQQTSSEGKGPFAFGQIAATAGRQSELPD
jgi:shikimate kinase